MPGRRNSSGSVSSDVSVQGSAIKDTDEEPGSYERQRAIELKAWKEKMADENSNPPARGQQRGKKDDKGN